MVTATQSAHETELAGRLGRSGIVLGISANGLREKDRSAERRTVALLKEGL